MSDEYPTLDALVALGFEHQEPEFGMETVGYRFRYLDLKASATISRYFQPDVLLSGVLDTGRTLSQIEHHLPASLGTPQEAAAWVSYVLKSDRSDLEPLPAWFLEGECHWDLVPAVREEQASQERLEAYRAAYQASPKCFIDREYARPLRRKLQAALSEIAGEAEMTFNFDGRVLSIALCGAVHEVVASGESWPSSYQVTVSSETRLPPRFTSSTVEVNVFKDNLILAELRLGPCEVAAGSNMTSLATATAEQRPSQGFGPHIGGGGLVTISLSALPGSDPSLWGEVVPGYKLTETGQDTEAVRTALDDAEVKWLETEGADGTRGVLAEIPSDNFILRWFGAGDWVRIVKSPFPSDLHGSERAVQKVAAILIEAGLVAKGEHH